MTGAVEERRGQWVSEVHTPELLRNLRKDVKQGVSCILERRLRLPRGRRTAEANAAVTEREEGGPRGAGGRGVWRRSWIRDTRKVDAPGLGDSC